MKSKKRIYWIGLGASMLAMFAWIFVAVALTGGREIEDFTPRDEKIMTGFIVVELLTVVVAMVFAVLLGAELGRANREKIQKMPPVKHPERGLGWTAAMFLLSIGLGILGDVLIPVLPVQLVAQSGWVFGGLCLLSIALMGLNAWLSGRSRQQLRQKNVAQMQSYIYSHRESAAATAAEKLPKLIRCRCWTVAYAVFLGLMGMLIAFTAGVALDAGVAGGVGIWSTVLLMCPVSRIRFSVAKDIFKEAQGVVSAEEEPELYAVAREAAEKSGCREELRIILTPDWHASIAKVEQYCFVQLGVILLGMMTREELFCILLHEFSHVTGNQRQMQQEGEYYSWLQSQRMPHFFAGLTSMFFAFPDLYYTLHFGLYRYATSLLEEMEADRAMLKSENPAAIATGLVKLQYYMFYDWEKEAGEEESLYAPEEPQPNHLMKELEAFRKAAACRAPLWDELTGKEIRARTATHPTLVERLAVLELERPRQVSVDMPDETLCSHAIAHVEAIILENVKKNYAQIRQEAYLMPLNMVRSWEESGCPVTAEDYADIVWALRELGRSSRAEELCQQAIDTLSPQAAAHGYFIRGCTRLHRFDREGIADIYTAMQTNRNFLEEGLLILGNYCCMAGEQEELERYRQWAVDMEQKYRDEDIHANSLHKKDRLSSEQLPDGMLEDILRYIHSVDEGRIQRIYLVRKTITESFFSSVFVVEFETNTPEDQHDEILHKIFRYLDTSSDWQFSLFDRQSVAGVPLDKIPGSCVYRKESI